MSRTTWSLADETAEYLETVANRKDHESANDFLFRVAEMLDASADGTDVTKPNAESEPVPENVLTTDHLADIANMTARRTADEVEQRFR